MSDDGFAENAPLLSSMERQEATERPAAERGDATASAADHPDAPIPDSTTTAQQRRELEVEDDSSTSTPRFLQDDRNGKRWKWVPYPVYRLWKATATWAQGPQNPRDWKIKPVFPRIQEYPLLLVEKYLPKRKQRLAVVFFYVAIWAVTFALVKRAETLATEIEGWGTPSEIGCGATYWGAGNRCGINGVDCRPFNGSGFAFRCSANCRSVHVLNPRAVGDQEIVYQPFVIGGPNGPNGTNDAFYRGDSFICEAAIHAGVISNERGGCGVVKVVGRRQDYVSSSHHGIKSVGFDSYFPLSFVFEQDIECKSRDMRWDLLAVSVVYTSVMSLFTASSALFFFANFVGIFWHVGIASDPPGHSSIAGLVSNILGKFLPAMFCAYVMYDKMGGRRLLRGLTAQVEKTVLWLGACWVGALTNYTLDFIPISRLTGHDLQQQPGAKAALAIIVIVLFVIVVKQIWFFRQEGRLLKYLKLYALFVGGIVICLLLPGLNLRIHHYILALLLLPGTSMQTRPSLLYQGLLVGLFINGIARWGFDPLLQTGASLQGDAQHGSPLPVIRAPEINLGEALWTANFTWATPPAPRFDGISVLVNDVERFRTYFDDGEGSETSFLWERKPELRHNEYFRFAYMEGTQTWDYTKAGKWNTEGEWTEMKAGPSKVRARELEGSEVIKHKR
ncbi:hypothetical protein VD0002_g351 [Verticillium dahliae]|uniref:LCCL domain-containing protein n=4 Tax=Verticillium dahliae TaxID=27337 RepID=G2WU33_VERDV|nr:LCCL domain-containing protein [Verticillium dahliae VdLs.17]KAF3348366.1 Cryptochrome DASH [Verticillium dahliae VDG2]KAH6690908.1 LCCL domain-containing protein [Verticillium dahliae]EGY17624.1 LCCL domain-containing protein [Verticillium dahliae VdLs.17]PNH35553.1 hypothetical protein BJF96_g1321 [Verticillium dahliae]PNH57630.1 hypothetical protein VD0003_g281 [Verticillium dahliae]